MAIQTGKRGDKIETIAPVAPVHVMPDDLAKKKAQSKAHIERVKASQSEKTKAGAECGPIPPPVDPDRRDRYRFDLQGFAETYLQTMFMDKKRRHKRWAKFHIECFAKLQESIIFGGLFAEALPRGSAKTTMTLAAVIWAACYGHCKYAAVVCATDPLAKRYLENFKIQFEVQPLLLEDFPEICVPIRHLERKTQRCNSQTVNGITTRIEWNQEYCVFPTIEGSEASGFRFQTAGLTGSSIRGLLAANAEGMLIRPDVVILDDPQTDESARSVQQCQDRLELIETVMGMAGPGEKFTCFACVTVIREGDVADSILNTPDWQGVREGILTQMPTKEQLKFWHQYRDVQVDSKTRRLGTAPEIMFYRENQAAIVGEVKATWEDRFNPETEVDAVHHVMNLYFKFPHRFMAEFMNKPKSLTESEVYRLDPLTVRNRLTGLPRGVVPLGYDFITIGVDIQKSIIFFVVMAWKMDLTGTIIDYGWLPDQVRREFDLDNLDKTLQSESRAIESDIDAAVSWGLVELGKYLSRQKWLNEKGHEIFAKEGQIDINFRESESAVSRFCRTNKEWKSIFVPAMGQAMTATKRRISEWKDHDGQNWPKKPERRECQWMETNPRDHGCRERYFDTNHWKSYVNTALSFPLHASGSISIFGENPDEHRQLSTHLTSHFSTESTVKYNNGDEVKQVVWAPRPSVTRWDLLDCVVGNAVSASKHGARLSRVNTAIPASDEVTDRRIVSIPAHLIRKKGNV